MQSKCNFFYQVSLNHVQYHFSIQVWPQEFISGIIFRLKVKVIINYNFQGHL